MANVVSPTAVNPTHHINLIDEDGNEQGLIVSNNGKINELLMTRSPVDVTAMKISQGNPTYGDLEPPYYAIAQNSMEGGLGNDDFEKNTTAYMDGARAHTMSPGKVHANIMERYTSLATADAVVKGWPPVGTLTWKSMSNKIAIRLEVTGTINMYRATVLVRRISQGDSATPLTAQHVVNATDPGIVVTSEDYLKGEISGELARYEMRLLTLFVEDGSAVPVANTTGTHWLVFDATSDYEIATFAYGSVYVVEYTGGAWVALDVHTPYILMSNTYRQGMFFDYLGMTYLAYNDDKIYRLGDRGVADNNTGNLNKLVDASKSWTVNQWAGAVVVLKSDTLREDQRWRRILSNDGTSLTVDKDWAAANTGAQYTIIGTTELTEVATGVAGQILDVVVSSEGVLYIMTTSGVYRMREYNNAGTWTVDAPTADITNAFRLGVQVGDRLWGGRNNLVNSSPIKAWGTNLVLGENIQCGPDDGIITGLESYVNESGEAALWVFKDNIAGYIYNGKFYPMDVREMRGAQDDSNGQAHAVQDTYLYFNMGPRLQRYYSPQIDDLGPNNLPLERVGKITQLRGMPGQLLVVMNAADFALDNNDPDYDLNVQFSTGKYSSILSWTGGGFHELYRAPNGARITDIFIQSIHGDEPGLLWFLLDGTILGRIELPSYTTDLTDDPELDRFSPEWMVQLSPISAGMKDLVKYCKKVKLYAEALAPGTAVNNLYVDVLIETNGSKYWENVGTVQVYQGGKEMYEVDLGTYGKNGKALTFRLRGKSTRMPVVYAVVVEVIARTGTKFAYTIPFVIEKGLTLLTQQADTATAESQISRLDGWGSGGPLYMESVNPLFHGKTVIMRPITIKSINKVEPVIAGESAAHYQYIGVCIVQDV